MASIIQKEARQTNDFYKVSRVFANRLKIGMKLQSDATVSYGSGGTTVSTTSAERANPNGYNTYVRDGIVEEARWVPSGDCATHLSGGSPWVAEPVGEWLADPWTGQRSFGYRIVGTDRSSLVVTRV